MNSELSPHFLSLTPIVENKFKKKRKQGLTIALSDSELAVGEDSPVLSPKKKRRRKSAAMPPPAPRTKPKPKPKPVVNPHKKEELKSRIMRPAVEKGLKDKKKELAKVDSMTPKQVDEEICLKRQESRSAFGDRMGATIFKGVGSLMDYFMGGGDEIQNELAADAGLHSQLGTLLTMNLPYLINPEIAFALRTAVTTGTAVSQKYKNKPPLAQIIKPKRRKMLPLETPRKINPTLIPKDPVVITEVVEPVFKEKFAKGMPEVKGE